MKDMLLARGMTTCMLSRIDRTQAKSPKSEVLRLLQILLPTLTNCVSILLFVVRG